MSEFFEKQESGVRIVSAAWVADQGKPDHPIFWNTCKFRLEDGTVCKVHRVDLENHNWKWIGQDDENL